MQQADATQTRPGGVFYFLEGLVDRMLVVDNYDSFTHNLVQMLLPYDLEILVFRSDKITPGEIAVLAPDYILISPGPKDPAHAGLSISVVRRFAGIVPLLGVCLGMQCINEAMGGATVRAPMPVHGKTSQVYHENTSVFKGVPCPFTAARYHSLMIEIASPDLAITARTEDGVIMGIEHKHLPVFGVQFHPESFMTEGGTLIMENFLRHGPLTISRHRPAA